MTNEYLNHYPCHYIYDRRKKQPIAYVFGRTMCITAEDIVTNLVKKINDLCGHTYNRYDEKLLDFESDS